MLCKKIKFLAPKKRGKVFGPFFRLYFSTDVRERLAGLGQ
jgi:hypothetical protein